MQVILTPTAVPDMFGPALNGFRNEVPPDPPTQLSAQWFNSVQMELVNAIIGQGYALDAMDYGQLATAIDNWSWSGTPELLSGAILYVRDGAEIHYDANATLLMESGSVADIGGTVIFAVGSNVTFNSTVIFAVGSNVTFNSQPTLQAGADLQDQTLQGSAGSVVAVERVECTDLELIDPGGVLLPTSPRRLRYVDTTLVIHESDGQIRSIDVADRGYQATFATPNAIDSTGAVCGRRIQEGEHVWLRVTFDYEHTSGALGTLSTRIQVNGVPGILDLNSKGYELKAAAGVRWQPHTQVFKWKPTDSFVLPGTQDYSFTARVGSSLGATLNLRDIGIEITSNVEV